MKLITTFKRNNTFNQFMKRALFILLVLFLAACNQQNPQEINQVSAVTSYVRSGTQGVEMQFVQNLPPRQMYETGDLVTLIELRNKGSHDLGREPFQQCFVHFGGFDKNIIRGVEERQTCGDLPGKSAFLQDGGFTSIEFTSRGITLPADTDKYVPPLVATVCYEYKTIATPQVCVDPNFFEITSEQKACIVRDAAVSGGQAAPVAVTAVNVDMAGPTAIFTIDISNVGGGRVISPRTPLTKCPKLDYNDFDEVQFSVELPSGQFFKCAPETQLVRLTNGRGRFVCQFKIGNTPAYQTPLRVELNYNYMNTVRRDVEIIRTPQFD